MAMALENSDASSNHKILVVSYAFPPLKVAMASCVAKAISALNKNRYSIDVLCADTFLPFVSRDDSLLSYVSLSISKVIRLRPVENGSVLWKRCKHIFFHFLLPRVDEILKRAIAVYPAEILRRFIYGISTPDPMAVLKHSAMLSLTECLLKQQYLAVLSFSPFHSVNPVMLKFKTRFPQLKWIAQFSDPWAQNPLEEKWTARIWAKWYEPRVIRAADFIIHNSQSSLDLMVRSYGESLLLRSAVIHHPFDITLYPVRPKSKNATITLRHVGVLFGHRSPDPLFSALNSLFFRREDLRGAITIDFVGSIEKAMLETPAAKALPLGTVICTPGVNYLESLEKMYDADILLLIEANTRNNLFMPSKLSDYIGAGTPILGIVPQGPSLETLERLGAWHVRPSEVNAISLALEDVIDYARNNSAKTCWRNESVREEFSINQVGKQYAAVLEKLAAI